MEEGAIIRMGKGVGGGVDSAVSSPSQQKKKNEGSVPNAFIIIFFFLGWDEWGCDR